MGTVGGRRRVAIAAALMAVVLFALLGAWFATGWHDVRAREAAIEDAPVVAAAARAGQLARELRGELDQLVEREASRPYFHYQNLFHDPRAPGESVTPSPLASGPEDPLILGYFQIDANARVTTPSINDQFPQLSETKHLVEHRAFRDAVALQLAQELAPPRGVLIAQADPKPHPPPQHRVPRRVMAPPPGAGSAEVATQAIESPPNTTQTYQLDPNAYTQNSNANAVYSHQTNLGNENNRTNTIGNPGANQNGNQTGVPNVGGANQTNTDANQPPTNNGTATNTDANLPDANQTGNSANQTGATNVRTGNQQTAAHAVHQTEVTSAGRNQVTTTAPPVTITVSSLEWHTLPFSGGASLVAVREVQTPDGNLAQGFIVDRAAMTSWLADHAGDLVAELHPRDAGSQSVELVPGWELTVEPNPREMASSVGEAARVATAFIVRFLIVGAIALFAAMLVVWLVARAERYARERSQFAAAAAHELRTPLAGLQLYGDMLSDGLGDPAKLRDYARRMSEEASRLGRVVSNVLGFSQLERGNLSIDPKLGNVAAALRDLVEHVQPTFDRAGAAIDLDVPQSLDARFDRDALARIVGNLLDNAEKYTREAEDRTIHLTAKRAGEWIEIAVRDHGAGVAAPTKLFQAFARGVSTDGPAGLGLGLALSRSLATAMGGALAYREGDGATFVLRVPVA